MHIHSCFVTLYACTHTHTHTLILSLSTDLWCCNALHDGHKGEEIAKRAALEQIGNVDESAQHLGPVQRLSCTDNAEGHQLRETQVSAEAGGERQGHNFT